MTYYKKGVIIHCLFIARKIIRLQLFWTKGLIFIIYLSVIMWDIFFYWMSHQTHKIYTHIYIFTVIDLWDKKRSLFRKKNLTLLCSCLPVCYASLSLDTKKSPLSDYKKYRPHWRTPQSVPRHLHLFDYPQYRKMSHKTTGE